MQQEATTGKLSDGNFFWKKTKTTTSLAVMKRTARQGEHWNNEERGPQKVPGAPQGGSCLKRQRRQLFGESQKKAKIMSYTIFDNLALSDLHFAGLPQTLPAVCRGGKSFDPQR